MPGVGGAVFDDDDVFAPDDGGAPLELDMGLAPPPPKPPTPVQASQPPRSVGSGTERGPAFEKASAPPQSLAPIPPSALEVDQAEAASIADYGEAPTSLWQTPLYTYRVKTRQGELRKQLSERQADLARARQAEEAARLAFADRARSNARGVESLARPLEAIEAAERTMVARDGALSAELTVHQSRLAVIDERVAGLSKELAEARAEERKLEAALAEADAIRQRAEAKLKRAEIEVRNASSIAEAAALAERGAAKRAGGP